ncbi:MAG TPA: hypothetical protein VFV90_06155 [Usitatibacter sp.]|nr:hypothetical protein [Usitatibacter sp.]
MLAAIARILVQLVVTGPVAFFYPFLAFATGHTVYDVFARPQAIGAFSLVFVAGGLGLTGLYLSILVPVRSLRARPWLKWTVTGLMAFGIALAVLALVLGADTSSLAEQGVAWSAWLFAGPLVVALWNVRRMFAGTGAGEGTPTGT